eukprot:m.73002 g.73002  ORF g.73002 m.73002 type:complete len:59 (+) comp12376_c0_seq5:65-241(+)
MNGWLRKLVSFFGGYNDRVTSCPGNAISQDNSTMEFSSSIRVCGPRLNRYNMTRCDFS